jgi:hypothetical protein
LSVVGDFVVAADLDGSTANVLTCDGSPATVGTNTTCGDANVQSRNMCERFGCSGGYPTTPGERPSDYCLNSAVYERVTFAESTQAVASAIALRWGFLAAQGTPSALYVRGCPFAGYGGCGQRPQIDCGNISNWSSLRLPASGPVSALSMMTTDSLPEFGGSQTNDSNAGSFVAYHAGGWRVAGCYGLNDPQMYGAWHCMSTESGGGARAWSSIPIAPALSEPVASSLERIGDDLVLIFHERQRTGVSVCRGIVDCSRSTSWLTSIVWRGDAGAGHAPNALLAPVGDDQYLVPLFGGVDDSELRVLTGGSYEDPD